MGIHHSEILVVARVICTVKDGSVYVGNVLGSRGECGLVSGGTGKEKRPPNQRMHATWLIGAFFKSLTRIVVSIVAKALTTHPPSA